MPQNLSTMSTLPTPRHRLQPLLSPRLMSQKLRSSLAKTSVTGRNTFIPCWTCMKLSSLDLSIPKLDATVDASQLQLWVQANKVCRHTLVSVLSNDLFLCLLLLQGIQRDMWLSYIQIPCRGHGWIEIHHRQLLLLDHKRRKRHRGTNQRIPQAAGRPED